MGHGLSTAPKMVIVKSRGNGGNEWCVWHTSLTNGTYYLYLNGTAAQAVDTTFWNSTTPTNTVINLGTNTRTNQSGNAIVAYAWSEVAGYSKFGSYTGNGSTDGPFVYTGFQPKFIMIKRTDSTSNWAMFDTARSPYNLKSADLYANLSDAEAANAINPYILSNGFKVSTSNATWNGSGGTWIYMAFASNPFNNANAF